MPIFPIFPIQIVCVLLVIGVILWLITKLPLDEGIRQTIRYVIYALVAIWLIYILAGVLTGSIALLPHRP
jgi:hypothetical protein